MQYIVKTEKSVDEVVKRLEENVKANSFGVLHVHNIKATMHNKGVEFDEECLIYEICNPHFAKKVLSEDMSFNMALPCKVSVYTENGDTKIAMMNPSAFIESSHESEILKETISLVENTIKKIIDLSK